MGGVVCTCNRKAKNGNKDKNNNFQSFTTSVQQPANTNFQSFQSSIQKPVSETINMLIPQMPMKKPEEKQVEIDFEDVNVLKELFDKMHENPNNNNYPLNIDNDDNSILVNQKNDENPNNFEINEKENSFSIHSSESFEIEVSNDLFKLEENMEIIQPILQIEKDFYVSIIQKHSYYPQKN